jgi:hypothetical protein
MSKKIFCVTSSHSVGATFLDWSIHYLNNQDKFFNTELGSIELVSNPLTKINAHGHLKNFTHGLDHSKKAVQLFNKENDGIFSFYPGWVTTNACAADLNIPIESIGKEGNFAKILNYKNDDYANIWDMCDENNIRLIYMKLTDDPLYLLSVRTLARKILTPELTYQSVDEIIKENIEIFFKNSADQFFTNNNANLWPIWDLREFLSINIRPFEISNLDKKVNFNKSHLYLNAREWWLNGNQTIGDVMEYLELTINRDRLSKWNDIYITWQQIQIQILKFQWNFDHICDSIVNNKFYSLKEYNLTLLQEAAIQHVMLYKYGLNFKIYGLEKFPENTQDLHALLEPNVNHNIQDIYNCLK